MGIFLPSLPNTWQSERPLFSVVGAVAAHTALIALLASVVPTEELSRPLQTMAVRLVETSPDLPRLTKPAQVKPPKAQRQKPAVQAPPQTLLTSSTVSEIPTAFAVPQPVPAKNALTAPVTSAAPIIPVASAPVAVEVTDARFDADYLDNPKPRYPPASRRLGEQGRVLLRVHVSATGLAETVEIKLGSGFARLDKAAHDAVSRWRFVPARRGELAIATWVQVPIIFQLES
ncbi:MAG: energy transducer TonB [Sulfuritalea sp.]|nr:energy transducer TonB [Sulfuritalea sp.]